MQNLSMPIEQAFTIVDGVLAQVNANRENHALMSTAVARIRQEIERLGGELEASNQHNNLLQQQIKELREKTNSNPDDRPTSPDSQPD